MWDHSILKFKKQINVQLYFATIPDSDKSTDYDYLPRPESKWSPPFSTEYSNELNIYINHLKKSGAMQIRRHTRRPSQIYLYIHQTLKSLRQNTDIIIKPADKNLGLVIMNRSDYKDMCLVHLNDSTTYKPIEDKYYYKQSWAKLQLILNQFNVCYTNKERTTLTYLARSLFQLRLSEKLRPATFYCLPKVHKNQTPIPGRPIASAPSTITYYTSIYLNNILKPLLPQLPTICQSSSDAIRMLSGKSFPNSAILFTADVKSLYPSIPIKQGLDSVMKILELSKRFTSKKILFLITLMRWVLTNNYLEFDHQTYLQIEGTAMGTPMAPTYAILFMFAIERHYLKSAFFYTRYIDDIFGIFTLVEHIDEFVNRINNAVGDRLKLESIVIGQQCIFLDLKFTIQNGHLIHELFQKTENTYAYIPTFSDHPRAVFNSFVQQELQRYYRNCSEFHKFLTAANEFKIRLAKRGYKPFIFENAYNTLLKKHLPINIPSSTRNHTPSYFQTTATRHFHAAPLLPTTSAGATQQQKKQKRFAQPILTISTPVLNNQIKWKQLATIPENLQDTLSFRLAYKSSEVLISKRSPRTLGSVYISSKF